MKSVRLALTAASFAFFAMLAPSPAQAYEGVDVFVTDRTVVGGDDVSITARVEPSSINCTTFTLEYDGQSHTEFNTSSITHTFETDEVDDETDTTAFATCNFDDGQLNSGASLGGGGVGSLGALVAAPQSSSGTGTITLLPEDDDGDGDEGDDDGDDNGGGNGDDNGGLPDTGGERLTWLLIGSVLVLVGAGTVFAARRRSA